MKASLKALLSKLVNDPAISKSIIVVQPAGNITRSGTGDSIVSTYNTVVKIGSALSNNGSAVVIGAGVSYVKIAYQLDANTTGTNHYMNGQLYVNQSVVTRLGQDTHPAGTGHCFASRTINVLAVQQGDKIQIGWYGHTGDTLYSASTALTVEVIG